MNIEYIRNQKIVFEYLNILTEQDRPSYESPFSICLYPHIQMINMIHIPYPGIIKKTSCFNHSKIFEINLLQLGRNISELFFCSIFDCVSVPLLLLSAAQDYIGPRSAGCYSALFLVFLVCIFYTILSHMTQ